MAYSIAPILHSRPDKNGLHKVLIRVTHNRKKHYLATILKVQKEHFVSGQVVTNPHHVKMNGIIRKEITDLEDKLLELAREKELNDKSIGQLLKGDRPGGKSESFKQFAYRMADELAGKYAAGSLKNYRVVGNKVDDFAPGIKLSAMNVDTLNRFERYLRDLEDHNGNPLNGNNTISKNMQTVKAILTRAADMKLIGKAEFDDYKKPTYRQTLPTWLTEKEVETLADLVFKIKKNGLQLAGHYFLLCCYTGYRISDSQRFKYEEMVQGNKIILRAQKNGNIVSIPIHKRLKPVLEFCKKHPFDLSPERARIFVKELCSLAGIKKDVKFHSSRHSFAMMLMANGFTIDEVAVLIGNTPLIAKVYARVHNELLDKKILQKLG